jgi:hypothetical protein
MKLVQFDETRKRNLKNDTWNEMADVDSWNLVLKAREDARLDWSKINGDFKDMATVSVIQRLNDVLLNYEVYLRGYISIQSKWWLFNIGSI